VLTNVSSHQLLHLLFGNRGITDVPKKVTPEGVGPEFTHRRHTSVVRGFQLAANVLNCEVACLSCRMLADVDALVAKSRGALRVAIAGEL
jgi:hypothetical protein